MKGGHRQKTVKYSLPSSFTLDIRRITFLTYELRASQILHISQERAFEFFEDPRNLSKITPPWLNFRMRDQKKTTVYENAEFKYTIKLFGLRVSWRSKIVDYKPPKRFTDVQIRGPYRLWIHQHNLKKFDKGILMEDTVTYTLPLLARPLHHILIKKQLEDIFSYRAVKVAEWAKNIESPAGMGK